MQLKVRNDNSELLFYREADFPVYLGRGRVTDFPGCAALAHWHDDLEFSVVLSGSMEYNINGEIITLSAGDGIFINTRQLHFNFSQSHGECEYLCLLFHPMLLCSSPYLERSFVAPILQNSAFPYRILRKNNVWEERMIHEIQELFRVQHEKAAALKLQSGFFRIWSGLYENAPLPESPPPAVSQHLSALKSMVAFLQKHYREKVSLAEIAEAGAVSKTTCCHIFEKYCNQTPVAYLIEYRLRSGVELLKSTDMTVTEICYEVGFTGASYFSESFRKAFGCSPTEFRRQYKAAPDKLEF